MNFYRDTVALLSATLCAVALSLAPVADAATHNFNVRIESRAVVEPASKRVVVPRGASVEILWHSDETGELHVHGYDLAVHLRADTVVRTRFVARATGRFPVTSHGFGGDAEHGHGALLYLEVHPD